MKRLSLILVVLLLAAGMAFAQKEGEGKFGLLLKVLPMSYDDLWTNLEDNPFLGTPAFNIHYQEIGIVYNISPKLAIKPTLVIGFPSYTASYEETDAGVVVVPELDVEDFKATILGGTAAVDYTFLRFGDAAIFTGGLVRAVWISTEQKDLTVVPNEVWEVKDFEISLIASLGGQYMFGSHFGVWGRGGIGFTYISGKFLDSYATTTETITIKGKVIFTYQGSLGIVFYIK